MKINEPIFGKRYLVLIKCKKGVHNCLAYNFPNPCCTWNILYYSHNKNWEWSTDDPLGDQYDAIAWSHLPEIPKELMTYEN